MRVDLDKLERELHVRKFGETPVVLVDVATEHRVIVAWLSEHGASDCMHDVEVDDFHDPRCRAVVTAIRNISDGDPFATSWEERWSQANYVTVMEAIEQADREQGKHVADSVGDWLADLIGDPGQCPPYCGNWISLRQQLQRLRQLAVARREIVRVL